MASVNFFFKTTRGLTDCVTNPLIFWWNLSLKLSNVSENTISCKQRKNCMSKYTLTLLYTRHVSIKKTDITIEPNGYVKLPIFFRKILPKYRLFTTSADGWQIIRSDLVSVFILVHNIGISDIGKSRIGSALPFCTRHS